MTADVQAEPESHAGCHDVTWWAPRRRPVADHERGDDVGHVVAHRLERRSRLGGPALLSRQPQSDEPGGATAAVINDNVALDTERSRAPSSWGVSLVFLVASVRNVLRSGGCRGGDLLLRRVRRMAPCRGGPDPGDRVGQRDAVGSGRHRPRCPPHPRLRGLLGLGRHDRPTRCRPHRHGLVGVRNAVLPRWFAITSTVMGVLTGLGAAHIPPGGLVTYLLLPCWWVAASVVVARGSGGPQHRRWPLMPSKALRRPGSSA